MKHGLIKTFVRGPVVKGFELPIYDRPVKYGPVPDFWVGWEPSPLMLVPSPSIFAYPSGIMQRWSRAHKVHVWWIATISFLAFGLVSFVAAARNGFFMYETGGWRIAADCSEVLVLMPGPLTR